MVASNRTGQIDRPSVQSAWDAVKMEVFCVAMHSGFGSVFTVAAINRLATGHPFEALSAAVIVTANIFNGAITGGKLSRKLSQWPAPKP